MKYIAFPLLIQWVLDVFIKWITPREAKIMQKINTSVKTITVSIENGLNQDSFGWTMNNLAAMILIQILLTFVNSSIRFFVLRVKKAVVATNKIVTTNAMLLLTSISKK